MAAQRAQDQTAGGALKASPRWALPGPEVAQGPELTLTKPRLYMDCFAESSLHPVGGHCGPFILQQKQLTWGLALGVLTPRPSCGRFTRPTGLGQGGDREGGEVSSRWAGMVALYSELWGVHGCGEEKITPGITNLSPKLAISFNREHRGVTGLRLWQRRVVGSGNVSG